MSSSGQWKGWWGGPRNNLGQNVQSQKGTYFAHLLIVTLFDTMLAIKDIFIITIVTLFYQITKDSEALSYYKLITSILFKLKL